MQMAIMSAQEGSTCLPLDQNGRSGAPGETLADRIRRALEADISSGRLEPGSKLDEQELAEQFGVSRTPVREAFRLLAASHLVELRGRQGAVVRTISAQSLIEMFQVMAELEGLCARLAARRANPAQLGRIEAIHKRLEDVSASGDVDLFYDVNQEFHEAVYEASCNGFLADQTRRLRNQVAAYRRRVTHRPSRIPKTLKEHGEVIAAIRAHDDEAAQRAMRDHVNLLGDDLLDFLAAYG
ncbi:MAG: GntR family transcriptional regulator [Rhizobiales bacterium]|nr:GntR family transcriptional regulator [Hyphomicrobiales bacterium]UJX46745.1 GntR family transcriptional regulator [Xanthobacter sp. YC-JY1]